MFLYLFMYSLQQRIGKKILAVSNSKGKCMSPPSASCISLSINFKTAKFPQTKTPLPWFSILTFPQRQACLFFQEFRRGFATVLTFCIIFFLLHLEKKEKKKKHGSEMTVKMHCSFEVTWTAYVCASAG